MAVIYLKHEIHGAKVACSEQEAIYDEGHGWTRFDVASPAPAPPVEIYVPPVPPSPTYEVTPFNGMQPSNAMPKPRRRRRAINDGSE